MTNKLSIQDYYYQQRRVADTYDISDSHAGCYITHFPSSKICGRCNHAHKCKEISAKESKKD